MRVGSQANLDTLAYRAYTWGNRSWEAEIPMALNHNLELGEVVAITYTDVTNGLAFTGAKFLIEGLSYEIDLETKSWSGKVSLEQIP